MFQNMLVTGLTPLSNLKNEVDRWDNKPFTTVWPETHHKQKETEITRTIKKKNKRARTAFTTDQLRALEKTFAIFKYVDTDRRRELAATLNISEKTIKVWFQNRRMKEKRESSESSCDSSSEALNITPPPPAYNSPAIESTSFYQSYVNDGVDTPTVEYNNQVTYDQSYQTRNYENQAHQMPALAPTAFVYDTNVYPTQYYPNSNYYGYYSNSQHYTNQNYTEQGYENWLENFDLGYY